MTVLQIHKDAGYKGYGRAWGAVDASGVVIALRYMDAGTQQSWPVPDGQRDYRAWAETDFAGYREAMKAELAQVGTVISGECSCWEFISKNCPRKLATLTPEENRLWERCFAAAMNEGATETIADREAWETLQREFPRLRAFDGARTA